MEVIRQCVDYRHRGVGGKALYNIVAEGADHHHIDHGGNDPCTVLDRLAAPQLGVLRRQEHGVTTELCHAGLKGDARARGGLGKNHPQHLARKLTLIFTGAVRFFHGAGAVYQCLQLVGAEVEQSEEVPG